MDNPPYKQEENYREFYESVGKLYPEEDVVYCTLRGLLRRKFVNAFLEKSNGLFLDLGCNRGYYIANYKNGKAVGIDIAFSVLKIAKIRKPEGCFVQGDVQNLSFIRSNSINSILCSEIIEHVPNSQRVLNECFRILKPAGNLLVTTPNYKRQRPSWVKVGAMKKYGVQGVDEERYFHTAFRPEELKTMALNAGFRLLEYGTLEKEVKYATRIPVLFYHVIRLINRFALQSEKVHCINEKFLERSSLLIYKVCIALGLNKILSNLVREGVRTYIVAQKPDFLLESMSACHL